MIYIVIVTEYEEYRMCYAFESRFEAEKFIRHNILESGWAQFIQTKEILK